MKKSTCVYLIRDGKWLMLLRNKKQDDINHGKWIGVGGKNEPGETYRQCAVREVYEETGCTVNTLDYAGLVDFCYSTLEPEQIAVYTCRDFTGEPGICGEGTLAWIDEDRIMDLDLWEGDRVFLEYMIRHVHIPFNLRLEYDDEGVLINVAEGDAVTYE